MPRTPRTKSQGKNRKRSFKTKVAGQLKIKKLLRDIDEARHYGINLRNNISLGEMYSYLEDARKQKKQHEEEHTARAFRYDDMQDALQEAFQLHAEIYNPKLKWDNQQHHQTFFDDAIFDDHDVFARGNPKPTKMSRRNTKKQMTSSLRHLHANGSL